MSTGYLEGCKCVKCKKIANEMTEEHKALLQDMKVIDNNRKIVERLKKELKETEYYLANYPNYEGSGTVEIKKRIVPILQKILGEEK